MVAIHILIGCRPKITHSFTAVPLENGRLNATELL